MSENRPQMGTGAMASMLLAVFAVALFVVPRTQQLALVPGLVGVIVGIWARATSKRPNPGADNLTLVGIVVGGVVSVLALIFTL